MWEFPSGKFVECSAAHLKLFFISKINGCEFESRSGEVYSIQHYVIKFINQCGNFHLVNSWSAAQRNKVKRSMISYTNEKHSKLEEIVKS
jgi:hypothetical protein